MTCRKCLHDSAHKFGTYGKRKIQRYRCRSCNATFADTPAETLGSHYTDLGRASKVLALMLEGMSVRAISRITDMDKNTILSLLLTAGQRAQAVFDSRVRAIPAKYVQADEVWGFCHTKESRTRRADPAEWGHSYLWVALDADTKMVLAYHTGKRTPGDAYQFVTQLANRVHGHFQLTTDGFGAYIKPVEDLLYSRSDYAQLVKVFQTPANAGPELVWHWQHPQTSPQPRSSAFLNLATSPPASFERWNLGLRMHLRRFTRLTNAHRQETGEPQSRHFAIHGLVQLRPRSFLPACYPCDGSGPHGSHLEPERVAFPARIEAHSRAQRSKHWADRVRLPSILLRSHHMPEQGVRTCPQKEPPQKLPGRMRPYCCTN